MKRLSLYILIVLLSEISYAQRVSFEKSEITLGDQIKFTLEIPKSIGDEIIFPEFENVIIDGIEIIEKYEKEYGKEDNLIKQSYLVTSFEDSLFLMYPFEFKVDGKIIKTNPSRLKVSYMQPDSAIISKIDTTAGIQITDIKPPIVTPFTFKEFISGYGLYFIIAVIIAVVLLLIRYCFKKRKKHEHVYQKLEPKIPAHTLALERLRTLRSKELHKKEDLKPFYTELSYIVRLYLEDRFNIEALESVTQEIIDDFHETEYADDKTLKQLRELLSLSDTVKFAKNKPDEHENEIMIEYAFDFVNRTKLDEIKDSEIKTSEDE